MKSKAILTLFTLNFLFLQFTKLCFATTDPIQRIKNAVQNETHIPKLHNAIIGAEIASYNYQNLWIVPRVFSSHMDLLGNMFFCNADMNGKRRDVEYSLRGTWEKCLTYTDDNYTSSDSWSNEKSKRVIEEIIPAVMSEFKSKVLIRLKRHGSYRLSYVYADNSPCSYYSVNKTHLQVGISNVDVIFFLGIGTSQNVTRMFGYVDKCSHPPVSPLPVAFNFIPRFIMHPNIINETTRLLFKALNIPDCEDGKALLPLDNFEWLTKGLPKCIRINCTATDNMKMEYKNDNVWNECPKRKKTEFGGFEPMDVMCPIISDVCSTFDYDHLYIEPYKIPQPVEEPVVQSTPEEENVHFTPKESTDEMNPNESTQEIPMVKEDLSEKDKKEENVPEVSANDASTKSNEAITQENVPSSGNEVSRDEKSSPSKVNEEKPDPVIPKKEVSEEEVNSPTESGEQKKGEDNAGEDLKPDNVQKE